MAMNKMEFVWPHGRHKVHFTVHALTMDLPTKLVSYSLNINLLVGLGLDEEIKKNLESIGWKVG